MLNPRPTIPAGESTPALIVPARGSLPVRGAALWDALPPGTAGLPLVSRGAGAGPEYAALEYAAVAGLEDLAAVVTALEAAGGGSPSSAEPWSDPAYLFDVYAALAAATGGYGVLYQDSGGATAVTTNGDPVGLAKDLNGLADASQASSGSRPTYGATALNGGPAITFGSGLSLAAASFAAPGPVTGLTVHCALKVTDWTTNQVVFSSGGTQIAVQVENGRINVYVGGISASHTPSPQPASFLLTIVYDGTLGTGDRIKVAIGGSRLSVTLSGTVPTSLAALSGLTIGNLSSGGLPFLGSIGRLTVTNAAQAAATWGPISTYLAAPWSLAAMATPSAQRVYFRGDSLTNGYGLVAPLLERFSAQTTRQLGTAWSTSSYGVDGTTLATINGVLAAELDAATWTRDIVVLWAGTNDLGLGASGLTAYNRAVAAAGIVAAAGKTLVFLTPLPRSAGGDPADFEAQRQDFIARLVAGTGTFPHLVRLDLLGTIGVAGSQTNLTYYQGDYVHLNPRGHAVVAAAVRPVVEAI